LWKKDKKPLELKESKNYASFFVNAEPSDLESKEYIHQLHLEDIEETDQGNYVCVVSNNVGSSSSKKARVILHAVPSFTTIPSNVTLKAGEKARLKCSASGQPPPELSWTKDGGYDFPAARERRMHVTPIDNSFYIMDVKVEDAGVYSCRAKNQAAELVSNATLTVLQEPKFVKPMENKKSPAGDTAVLECSAVGSPKPSISWRKNGVPLTLSERHFLTADDQLLVIYKVTEVDQGSYTCVISNLLGSVDQTVNLTVTMPSTKPILPIIAAFLVFVCLLIFAFVVYLLDHPQPFMKPSNSDQDLHNKYPDSQTYLPPTSQLGMTPDVADFSIDLDRGDVEC
jgi:hypothetical protein